MAGERRRAATRADAPAQPPSSIERHPSSRRLGITWLVTRAVMLVLCATYSVMPRDLEYYVAQAHRHSLTTGMREYPFPVAVWLMLPAKALPFAGYVALFVATALLVDLAATWLFARHAGRAAAMRWTVFAASLGPLLYMRFDLFAAFSLVLVLVFARRRPAVSGLAAAAGAAVKLWPAVFGLGLLGPGRRRITHMVAAGIGGLFWAGVTVVAAGPARLVSPLTWQGERGFEIESQWGALLGLARVFGSTPVPMNKHQGSWEYTGALAEQWMWVVKPTQYLGYAALLAVLALGWRAGRDERVATLALTMTGAIAVFVLSSPVLSPQYLIWLLPGLVLVDDARVRRLGAVALALTQLELPFLFDGIFSHVFWFETLVRVVVVIRNLVLAWMAARAVRLLVARGRHTPRR